MKVITCSKCGKPIVGYYGVMSEVKKPEKLYCVTCAQSTTVWDLMISGEVETLPDIINEDDLPQCGPEYDVYADSFQKN